MSDIVCDSCNEYVDKSNITLVQPDYYRCIDCDELEEQLIPYKSSNSNNISWAYAMLEIEGLVNAEVSDLLKKDQKSIAVHLNKCLDTIKRGC